MEPIAGSIVRLSEQSQAIGEIIATVNDLAEQSKPASGQTQQLRRRKQGTRAGGLQ